MVHATVPGLLATALSLAVLPQPTTAWWSMGRSGSRKVRLASLPRVQLAPRMHALEVLLAAAAELHSACPAPSLHVAGSAASTTSTEIPALSTHTSRIPSPPPPCSHTFQLRMHTSLAWLFDR